MKRIMVITGHYGSGKTEVSVNLAVALKKEIAKVAILDMDIANPYFRSRERQDFLESLGIQVHHNSFGYDITEDIPALSATMKGPLENEEYSVVVDVGGDDSGARVLNQFRKYLLGQNTQILFMVNGNRPETETVEGCLEHLDCIQNEIGLDVHGLINNTHMLGETKARDLVKGYTLCKSISSKRNIPLIFTTCNRKILNEVETSLDPEVLESMRLHPIDIYMRPAWLG